MTIRWGWACVALGWLGMAAAQPIEVTVGRQAGEMRPLLGVNIGPLPAGEPGNADLTEAYRRTGITLVRTHDFYGPMDLATLYPNQDADPTKPASYRFEASDRYWRSIVDNGFEPYLRLGDSYNAQPGFPRPERHPRNAANLARAMVEVVRHYTDARLWGANKVRFVEIWNEPDNLQFWDGTPEEFYRLYCAAAQGLRQAFPGLAIGGPGFVPAGAVSPRGQRFTAGFAAAVARAGAPLDFLSFHVYANDVASYEFAARWYRQILDRERLTGTVLHVTEYHTAEKGLPMPEQVALRAQARGAATLTAGWMALQRHDVRQAMVYRGPDPSMNAPQFYGLFYANGQPKKTALAFGLWSELCRFAGRAATTSSRPELQALAGRDGEGKLALLVANLTPRPLAWRCSSLVGARRVREVSDGHEGVADRVVPGPDMIMPPWGVQLVTAP